MVDEGLQLYLKEVVFQLNEYEFELHELSQVVILNNEITEQQSVYCN
jgi:hypothetical protein